MKAHYSAADIARLQRVHKSTAMRWIKRGLFANAERPKGKQAWRVPIASYQTFIEAAQRAYERH